MPEWSAAYINRLPDAAFAVISSGGKKGADGRTEPRSLRHLPHHTSGVTNPNDDGSVDVAHLNNALARLDQTDLSAAEKTRAGAHLQGHKKRMAANVRMVAKCEARHTGRDQVELYLPRWDKPLLRVERAEYPHLQDKASVDLSYSGVLIAMPEKHSPESVVLCEPAIEPSQREGAAGDMQEIIKRASQTGVLAPALQNETWIAGTIGPLEHRALKEAGAVIYLGSTPVNVAVGGGHPVRIAKAVAVAKADARKQIVYCLVINPYKADSDGTWFSPRDTEAAAHRYLEYMRFTTIQHEEFIEAAPVESCLIPYPTVADYQAAMQMQPHDIIRMEWGKPGEYVYSGCWIAAIKINAAHIWTKVESGELTGFSFGGWGVRSDIQQGQTPLDMVRQVFDLKPTPIDKNILVA